jgi:hypothetical protein
MKHILEQKYKYYNLLADNYATTFDSTGSRC